MRVRYLLLIGCLAAALTDCAAFRPGAPEGMADVIAHRGASEYAPENTLSAFELAAAQKAHWFELDCTLSADSVVVVIHDDTLDRTTDTVGRVDERDYAEIRRYDAGSWFGPDFAAERVPTLDEALDLAKGRIGVYIEIKNSADDRELMQQVLGLGETGNALLPAQSEAMMNAIAASGTRNLELTRKTIAAVRARGMEREVVVQSFSAIVCAIALIEAPEIRTELLATSSDDDPLLWSRYLEWLARLDPAGFNCNKKDITPLLVRDVHARGATIAVWTVNEPDEIRRFLDMGVDALITNRPDVALELKDRH